jgi:hypothetical protein
MKDQDKTMSRVIRLSIPEDFHTQLREAARKAGISVNQFVMPAVAEKIGHSADGGLSETARRAGQPREAAGRPGQSTGRGAGGERPVISRLIED